MRLKYLTAIAVTAMAMISCDEGTGTIGDSLTSANDNVVVATEAFNVLTRSVIPDSVYSYSEECYLGSVRDPETGTFVESSFMAQYNMMEETHLPDKELIRSLEDGEVVADSCSLLLFFDHDETFGDSLAAMKIKVSELSKPVEDGLHYSNFDPKAKGYLREGGLVKYHSFSWANMNWSDSLRSDYAEMYYLRINLDDPYTDKNGRKYKNYGTYILQNYYEHPEYFKNSYAFIHNICPGFYFECVDGRGLMANFDEVSMRIYYRYRNMNGSDSIYISFLGATSTEEVMQTITVKNDRQGLQKLAEDSEYTYLKSPAGIFTEVTLPVDEVKATHGKDSLLAANMMFTRVNNQQSITDFTFRVPQRVLLIEKDSVNAFFENTRNYNSRYSFYTTINKNTYSFNNSTDISNLITRMYHAKQAGLKNDPDWVAKHPNWNKAMLIPVYPITTTTASSTSSYATSSSTTLVGIANEMGLTSTRLIRGTAQNPIKLNVIYGKFDDD